MVVGLVFAAVANGAPSTRLRAMWRFSAWAISGGVFLWHIGHIGDRTAQTPVTTAIRAAISVALAGFALAVVASLHSRSPNSPHSAMLSTSALVVWPLMLGIPAFTVALAIGALLARRRLGNR
jgi:hypothetical protein